ncbi:hypothetical protein [Acidihalobacter prosperus]
MWILKHDKKSVTISLNLHKAQDLLDGLLAHPDMGNEAKELIEKLKEAGIEPPARPDHIRYEHAPPL